jgi:LCP family protein required for cell wall assembly
MTIYVDPAVRPRDPDDVPPRPSRRGPKPKNGRSKGPKPKRKDPAWAKICLIAGAVVMLIAGAAVIVPRVIADWAIGNADQAHLVPPELQGKSIDGAINFLMLGMDQRPNSTDLIRADTIIVVHIPASHDSAYLVSLPRDAEVQIPAYPQTGFQGSFEKINAAFAMGAMKQGEAPDFSTPGRERGAALTMLTINNLVPGGLTFNGAAIINFDGFRDVLKAIGGVDICVDVETHSIHYDNKGQYHSEEIPYYLGKVYKVGCQHLDYQWALDYARQRHFDTGDYVRQRHQQQLLMAIFKKLFSRGTLTDPSKVSALQKSAGGFLTLDLGAGNGPLDWMFTLKGIDPKHVIMVKTNGGKITPGTISGNEAFSPDSIQMLQAVHDDAMPAFLTNHTDWITPDTTPPQK